MTEREALKLALEALKTLHDENMDYLTRNKLGGENNQCLVFAREAITAIKEALAQPEQEPVAWITQGGKGWLRWHKSYDDNKDSIPLYTTPPQLKPLTDEEIVLIVADCASSHQHTDIHFARAIERAHGIKELA